MLSLSASLILRTVSGHLKCAGPQPPQRTDHRPADDDREQQRDDQDGQHGATDRGRRYDRLLPQVLSPVNRLVNQDFLNYPDLADRLGDVAEPLLGRDPDAV
jgi:hypothetical protein